MEKTPEFPELTPELLDGINQLFTGYIFYERDRRTGDIDMYCTRCNTHWLQERIKQTMSSEDYALLTVAHNDVGTCPKCNRRVNFKSIGKSKGRINLWEQRRVVVFQPDGPDRVYIRSIYATKGYCGVLTPRADIFEKYRHILEPGSARRWEYASYYGWYACRNPYRDAFPAYSYMGNYISGYDLVNFSAIGNTFLRYSQLEAFERNATKNYHGSYYDCPVVKYLALYASYPQIEMLMKLGHFTWVNELVGNDRPHKRLVDWTAVTPDKFFRLTKAEYNSYREVCQIKNLPQCSGLQLFQNLKKSGTPASFAEVGRYIDELGINDLAGVFGQICKKYKLCHSTAWDYLQCVPGKIGQRLRSWRDYLDMAQKLKYDLKHRRVIMPKDLDEAHDTATKNLEYIVNAEKAERCRRRADKINELYAFEAHGYKIVVPESTAEIIREGKELHHCVGGYADRHADGKLSILFIRKATEPHTPLFTMEIDNAGVIRQIHGDRNIYEPAGAVLEFERAFRNFISLSPAERIKLRNEQVKVRSAASPAA